MKKIFSHSILFLCCNMVFSTTASTSDKGNEGKDSEKILEKNEEKKFTSKKAPNFNLPLVNFNNQSINLDNYSGKWLFLNFWASWCEPCRKELPILQNLYEQYKEKNIEVLAISIDEEASDAIDVLSDFRVSYNVALDAQGQVARKYNVNAMPTSFLISPDKKIVKTFFGFRKGYEEKYKMLFQTISNEK